MKQSKSRKKRIPLGRPQTLVSAIEEALEQHQARKGRAPVYGVLRVDVPVQAEIRQDMSHRSIAKKFAKHLVAGQYSLARRLLTPTLRKYYSAARLKRRVASMISYAKAPITKFQLMQTMEDWPGKESNDIGWAYVALWGDGFSEAVTVIVTKQPFGKYIRFIEWGRP